MPTIPQLLQLKLDLHLVRGLVETHNADVTIEDNHGETALFYANQSIDFQRNQEDEHDAVGGILGLNLQILLEGDEIAEESESFKYLIEKVK